MSPQPLEGPVKIARNAPNMRFKIAMTLLFTALSFVTAYNPLGLIVERVSEMPYLAFLRERILGPFRMRTATSV